MSGRIATYIRSGASEVRIIEWILILAAYELLTASETPMETATSVLQLDLRPFTNLL